MTSLVHSLRQWFTLGDVRSKAEQASGTHRKAAQAAIEKAQERADAADTLLRSSQLSEAARLSAEAAALTEEAATSVLAYEGQRDAIEDMALSAFHVPQRLRRAIAALVTSEGTNEASEGDQEKLPSDQCAPHLSRQEMADGLGAIFRVLERLSRAIDPPEVLRFVAFRRQVGAFVLLAAPVVLLAYKAATAEEPRYLAEYYSNERLEGVAELDEVPRVDFSWEYGAPLRSVTADHFSARWTTCLEVESAQELGLSLGIDDGARAFIESGGERQTIINDWEPGGLRWVTRTTPIEAGTHKLVIEYFERGGEATARAMLRSNGGAFVGELRMPDSSGECE